MGWLFWIIIVPLLLILVISQHEVTKAQSNDTPTDVPVFSDTPIFIPTITDTGTKTPTAAPTSTPLPTNTPLRTATITRTSTKTSLPTKTPTSTRTSSNTPTKSATWTASRSRTPTKTITPSPVTKTSTFTPTKTVPTNTALFTNTFTSTATPTFSLTPTVTNTVTLIPTNTSTFTTTFTFIPSDTPTPTDTDTPLPTDTPTPSVTFTLTETETSTSTDTATPSETLTETPTPTETMTPTSTDAPTPTPSPTPLYPLLQNIIAISSGGFHACAITTEGGVKCWGENAFGQLGDGSTLDRPLPVFVSGLPDKITAISSGYEHTCALTSGGGVKCWGYDNYGQLGDGFYRGAMSLPQDVVGLTRGVIAISAGVSHTCAVTSEGKVDCWGENYYGELGNGTNTDSAVPVEVPGLTGVKAIDSHWYHTCVITSSNGVMCWGYNQSGQLGDGTMTNRYSPVAANGLSSGVAALSLGSEHSCVLMIGGGIKCWGDNTEGQLGNGSDNFQSLLPVAPVGMDQGVQAMSSAGFTNCALLVRGGFKCWGSNHNGQLGDGTTTDRRIPVDVVGLTSGALDVSSGFGYACAITTEGGVKCWGINNYGQLGNGLPGNSLVPMDVLQPTPDPTLTPAPTATPKFTFTPTASLIPTDTATPEPTLTDTSTNTATPEPSDTATPTETETSTTTSTLSETAAPTETAVLEPTLTYTSTDTATPEPSDTPTPTATPTLPPIRTNTPTLTFTASITPTRTQTKTATVTITRTNTMTPTASFTASLSRTPTPSWTASLSRTASSTTTRTSTTTTTSTFTSTYSPSPSRTSMSTFTPAPTLILAITTPNGGEKWPANSMQVIRWTASSNVYFVTIAYQTCLTCTTTIASNVQALLGIYTWYVPNVSADTQMTIQITGYDSSKTNSVIDVSDAPFTVLAPTPTNTTTSTNTSTLTPTETFTETPTETPTATFTKAPSATLTETPAETLTEAPTETPTPLPPMTIMITSPNGGEAWWGSSTQLITWINSPDINLVEVSYEDSVETHRIVFLYPNTGSLVWGLPYVYSDTQMKIKITGYSCIGGDLNDFCAGGTITGWTTDYSDAPFTVLSPPIP